MNYPPFPYDKLEEMASFDAEYVIELKKLYVKFFYEFPIQYKECTITNPSNEKLALLDHKYKPSLMYLDLDILAKEIKKGREIMENPIIDTSEKAQILLNTANIIDNICAFYYQELTK